ncbi:MAG: ATP phosphoribosyltransferase regulatory subunit [Alphaproteobacteria bacterium]|nr:ATP phosphoribosyltransferase regulatory subunit [Alphaproteobacteria bacterium]
MSKADESLALLPNGFADVLPPDAEGEANSIHILMQLVRGFGYRRFKPPLLEFEDSLIDPGPGAHLSQDMFRLMDPVSHRMLGVRCDTTAQIARIASSRLKGEEHPLRLAYANEVLRTRAGQIRTRRQFTQVGCELIDNTQQLYGDIEICILPLLGLKALGIKDITIDLTVPRCIAGLIKAMSQDMTEDMLDGVAKAVEQRDVQALEAFDHPKTSLIAQMMKATGPMKRALPMLEKIDGLKEEPELRGHIQRLTDLCKGLEKALSDMQIEDVAITIDLIEQRGFEYHKMYGFTLFSSEARGELGRGGAYNLCFGDKKNSDTARGFTLYMDTVSKFTRLSGDFESVFVPVFVPFNEVKRLQDQGWITVRGMEESHRPMQDCTHVYKNGQVVKL